MRLGEAGWESEDLKYPRVLEPTHAVADLAVVVVLVVLMGEVLSSTGTSSTSTKKAVAPVIVQLLVNGSDNSSHSNTNSTAKLVAEDSTGSGKAIAKTTVPVQPVH